MHTRHGTGTHSANCSPVIKPLPQGSCCGHITTSRHIKISSINLLRGTTPDSIPHYLPSFSACQVNRETSSFHALWLCTFPAQFYGYGCRRKSGGRPQWWHVRSSAYSHHIVDIPHTPCPHPEPARLPRYQTLTVCDVAHRCTQFVSLERSEDASFSWSIIVIGSV